MPKTKNLLEKIQDCFDFFIALSASVLIFTGYKIKAADSSTVTVSVTMQNVSVSVTDGTVTYGTLSTNTSSDTTTGDLNDSQTAENDGNITQDLNIRGQDSADWTLGGTAGVDQYVHKFCTSDCDSSPTWTALTTSNATLVSSLTAGQTQVFDLQITTPTSSTVFTEQAVNVIVQASAS